MANIYGADVSKHQTDNVIKELAAGGKAEFVIARASIGSYTEDAKLKIFAPAIKAAGLKNSYYAASYSKNTREAEEEAEFICDLCEKYDNPPELAIMYDWEYFSADYIKNNFGIETTPQLVQEMTEAFCERVKQRGYVAGVYLNKDYWDRFYTDEFFVKHPDYKIWYARPGYSKPDKQCDIWQYGSDDGADFGYTGGNLDKNILITGYIDEVNAEPMKPLVDGVCRMKIGYASDGDIKKLVAKIEGLGIACDVANGYIITGEVSKGDQCYIIVDCNALGVAYGIFKEPEDPQCENCEGLKAQIAQMEENHKAELDGSFETIDRYIQDVHRLEEEKARLQEKLIVAQNKAEIACSQMLENDAYIQQLKTENGVLKETIVSLQEQNEELKQPKPPEEDNMLIRIFDKFMEWIKGGFK